MIISSSAIITRLLLIILRAAPRKKMGKHQKERKRQNEISLSVVIFIAILLEPFATS
jgi:hypothetical protein